jgi:hypothetical protein
MLSKMADVSKAAKAARKSLDRLRPAQGPYARKGDISLARAGNGNTVCLKRVPGLPSALQESLEQDEFSLNRHLALTS